MTEDSNVPVTKNASGTVENWPTFELLCHDMVMWAVIVVEKVEGVVLFQQPNFWEISVKGKALDGNGRFFDVEAVFPVNSDEERDRTISAMKSEAIYLIKGRYDFGQRDSRIRIFDAWYRTPEFNTKIVREEYETHGRESDKN